MPFEHLYHDIKDLDLSNEKNNFLKAKIKDCALSSFKLYNKKGTVSSLYKDEIFALKTLFENKDLIIQKSDKGNSIVLINKSDYLGRIYNILSDSKKIVISSVLDDKHLNFIIGIEKKLTYLLKELKHHKLFQKLITKNLNQEVLVLVFYSSIWPLQNS